MGKRGPQCSVCAHAEIIRINEAVKSVPTHKVAKEFKLSDTAVRKHVRLHIGKKEKKPLVVALPPKPESGSPKDLAEWHCERILGRMTAAETEGSTEKEIAGLYGQYTNALRHHARVSGALDITEAQILRSAPWGKIIAIVVRVLEKDHPKALAAVNNELKRIESEGA